MTAQNVISAIVMLQWDLAALDTLLGPLDPDSPPMSEDTRKALTFARERFQILLELLEAAREPVQNVNTV